MVPNPRRVTGAYRGGRLAALAVGAHVAAMVSAHAQNVVAEPETAASMPGSWATWAAIAATGVVALAALAIVATLRRRLNRQVDLNAALRTQVGRLEAFVAAVPEQYCGWSERGAAAISPGLASVLDVKRIERLEDLEEALTPGDAAALHSAYGHLRNSGRAFSLKVKTATKRRRLEVVGRRGAALEGSERIDLLWFRDITETSEALHTAQSELAKLAPAMMERQATLDALPVPVWIRDAGLALRWVNRAYAEAVEAGPNDVLAEQRELAAGAIAEGGRSLARRALEIGMPQSETEHVVVAGERRFLSVTEAPLSPDGEPVGPNTADYLVGYALDLTDAEDREAELKRHINAHGEVLENLRSAIAIFGPDRRLKFYNQAYLSLWGFDETWLETQPTLGEVLEDLREHRRLPEYADFPAFKRSQLDLFTSLIQPEEDLLHLPDGTTLRSVVTPHPMGGLLFVLEDVTTALMLERSYNTLMAVQRESLDNLAEGIAVFGSDGRLRLSNPAFASIWDLNHEELDSNPHIAEVFNRTERFFDYSGEWAEVRDGMIAWALDRQPTSGRIERADGSVLDYNIVPLPDGAVLNSYLDVSDSVRVEQALRASNQALETADRLKSEFIANVSYQLRTPLNAIMGFAEILKNQYFGQLNERQMEYTGSIVDASRRLLALINDILDIATIEAGYMELELSEVDVAEMMRGVHDLTREWAAKQSLRITIDCAADVGVIEADERRLKQALYNLLSNSVKFTPPGGQITMSARRDGVDPADFADEFGPGGIEISVRDSGIGIPAADQYRVFGRFERAHTQMRQSGVGLGLSLVKSFIEMHRGRVILDSRPGQGTTVRLLLPDRPIPGTGDTDPPQDLPSPSAAAGQ